MRSIRPMVRHADLETIRPSACKGNQENCVLKKELLYSRQTILARVKELAREISSDYAGKTPVIVGVLKGCVFFLSDLVMELTVPAEIDFMGAASYGHAMESSGEITFTKDLELPIKGKPVIVVEDIVDTGLTLNLIIKNLADRGPESIKICALIDKLERRERPIPVDYCGFQVEEGFLVGYGLDYNEQYRSLPDIYALR